MKKFKTLVTAILSLSILTSVGCSNSNNAKTNVVPVVPLSTASGTITTSDYEIFSVPATVKVNWDNLNYAYKQPAKVEFNSVINEYENYQLVITAKKDISNYSITLNNLSDGNGHTFSKDNFEVYNVLFHEAGNTTIEQNYANDVGDFYYGWYPDGLIPVEYAKPAGEMRVSKDKNAILWFTVYVPKGTEPAVYTGDFTLTVGNDNVTIPVTLKVNDYVLTDESTLPSTFGLRYNRIAAGELDNSPQMLQAHFDFYNKYRIALKGLPLTSDDVDEYLDAYVANYDKMSAIPIMTEVGIQPTNFYRFYEYVRGQIIGLAELSSPERNYLDKAYFYLYDEPHVADPAVVQNAIKQLENLHAMLRDIVYEIENDNTGKYDAFKQVENWQDYIIDIDNVVPWFSWATVSGLGNDENIRKMFSLMNTWAISYSSYGYSGYGPAVERYAEELGCRLWLYTAGSPIAPANYLIGNSNLLDSRTLSWSIHKHDFGGVLYWDATAYWSEETQMAHDYYTDASSASYLSTGDGNLTYPGAKYAQYGAYGPLPSMRVMSYRDGMEEYEMLCDLESKALELQEQGLPIDVDALMDTFYKQVLDTTGRYKHLKDFKETNFTAVRNTLINYVQLFNNDIDFFVMNTTRTNSTETITFYADNSCSVTIDGAKNYTTEDFLLAGNHVGKIYTYTYDLGLNANELLNLVLTNNGVDYTFTLAKSTIEVPIVNFTIDGAVTTSVKGSYAIDGNAVNVNISGIYDKEDLAVEGEKEAFRDLFRPYAILDLNSLGEYEMADFTGFRISLENKGEQFDSYVHVLYERNGKIMESKRILATVTSGDSTISIKLSDFGVDVNTIKGIKITVPNSYTETDGEVELNVYELTFKQILGY